MQKKALIFGNLLLILWLIFVYNFSSKNTIEKSKSEVTIFTLEPLLGIHAKMITADDKNIYIPTRRGLSREDLNKLNKSDIILSSQLLSESEIWKELQNYKGLYVTIPPFDNTKTHSLTTLTRQIELIRDTLSDITPSHRGFYYDNAGNYIHLLDTTFNGLRTRINKYTASPFITVGDNLNNFLSALKIEKYHLQNYTTMEELNSDKFVEEKDIKYIFSSGLPQESEIKKIQKKYPTVTIYRLPNLADDTSRWGYIRFVEKIMNDFVAAFDTYD